MRWLRRIGIGLALLTLIAGLCAWWAWRELHTTGLPKRSGQAQLSALQGPVSVRFDRFGVPHINAGSATDAACALGWLHANDRMTQLELGRRAVRGTLAEVAGEAALRLDESAYSLRLADTALAMWAACGPESRARLEAYAQGVNAWIEQRGNDLPPGLRILLFGLELEPWTPADSLGFGVLMSRDLSLMVAPESDRFDSLLEHGVDGLRDLYASGVEWPVAEAVQKLARRALKQREETRKETDRLRSQLELKLQLQEQDGSNAWVVDGTRTQNRAALLANDPHLGLTLPSPWFQAQVRAPGWEVTGFNLVGLPDIVIGQGPDVAWGFTNSGLDQSDLYSWSSESAYEAEERKVAVRSGHPRKQGRMLSEIGPAQLGSKETSLRWAGYEPFDAGILFRGLAEAHDLEDVRAAAMGFVAPAQNLLVATSSGEILHTIAGSKPLRMEHSGWLPVPAERPELRWQGYQAGPELLWRAQPASGALSSANDDWRPAGARGEHLGEFDVPQRAERALEVLVERDDWTPASFAELQLDTQSNYALAVIGHIERRWQVDAEVESLTGKGLERRTTAQRAFELLRGWDGRMDVDSGPAALYTRLEKTLGHWIFDDSLSKRHRGYGYHARTRLLAALAGKLGARWWAMNPELSEKHPFARELGDLEQPEAVEQRVLELALADAWASAARKFGPDQSLWRYARERQLLLEHPLSGLPYLGSYFTRGPWELPGSATTLDAFSGGTRISHGPSMRWIADPQNPDNSLASLPGGQSGHPFDAHYDDQIEDFLAGRYRPLAWSEAAIEAATVTTLELTP